MARYFEVECLNETTGASALMVFVAEHPAAAREQARRMGLATGTVEEVLGPAVAAPTETEAPAPAAAPVEPARRVRKGQGVRCPTCGGPTLPPGSGMQSASETVTCLLLLIMGLLPGVVYYVVTDRGRYCPKCAERL